MFQPFFCHSHLNCTYFMDMMLLHYLTLIEHGMSNRGLIEITRQCNRYHNPLALLYFKKHALILWVTICLLSYPFISWHLNTKYVGLQLKFIWLWCAYLWNVTQIRENVLGVHRCFGYIDLELSSLFFFFFF